MNVISTCFVLSWLDQNENVNYRNVEPLIYLSEPEFDPTLHNIHQFPDPFTAKNFIIFWLGSSVKVQIAKQKIILKAASNE